ncbi:MAG TPA: hypothetical protein VFA68_19260 [Terriglobales bacterium]|nr:hypothetical protein [Terriglobales bacterium]
MRSHEWAKGGLGAFVFTLLPQAVFAQSCGLCYTQAAAAGQRMIEALRSGILILIIPPTLMSLAMIYVLYRKRNQCRQQEVAVGSEPPW